MADFQLKPDSVARHPWHTDSSQQALQRLDSGPDGLDKAEVDRRRQRFGPNDLPERKRPGLLTIILRQFKDPLIYILLIAGTVSLLLGNYEDTIFIFAILVINGVIGTIQEWRAESSAQALQEMVRVQATVLRSGQRHSLDARELVPGDIVLLESGNSVPADLRLLESGDLGTDESLLTGESTSVSKDAGAQLEEDTPLGDRTNLVHAGTTVADGRGRGVVVRTGRATEVGKIAESLSEESEPPPLVVR
ncbi:MAG: HAD-IC family P-type ATPase, partial [Candidatus Competibacteraceae bacterium]|nr:HAD-IC family P-type ATPase [Candidatus Competibacteraceae bacterium]